MRLFVSIELPVQILNEAQRIQKELKQLSLFDGTYVRPENMHVTLSFFGSVDDEKSEYIKEQLGTIRLPPCQITLTALGLNSLSRPHVLWITIDAPLLAPLVHTISCVFPEYQEQRPFNGHITLARMKKVFDKAELKKTLCTLPVTLYSWEASEFCLWQSETLPEGPIYTKIMTYPLLSNQTNEPAF